ncbi:skin secretory protein xP2-like [Bos mutus]|uniref:skin secretory protein xP2-like n=1 Tax=Bos mutus TaxID=72004 RepID=UPI0038B42633
MVCPSPPSRVRPPLRTAPQAEQPRPHPAPPPARASLPAPAGGGGGASPPGVPTLPQEGPGPRPADASTHLRAARRVLAAHALGQRGGGGLGAVPLAACAMNEAAVQPPLCARRGPAPLQERKATPPVPPTQDWPLRGGRVERSWGDCVGDPGPCRGSLGWAAHCSAASALSLALIAPIPSPVGAETDGDLGTNSGAQGPPLRDSGPGIPQCWVFWSPRSKCPDPQGISGGRRRTGQRTLRSARSDGLASALRLGLP